MQVQMKTRHVKRILLIGIAVGAFGCSRSSVQSTAKPIPPNVSKADVVQPTSSDLRKAFLDHERNDYPEEIQEAQRLDRQHSVLGDHWVESERWKNYQKYAGGCPAIAEVTRVTVSRAEDSGDFVISMSGPSRHEDKDGNTTDVCSVWVRGGSLNTELPVRDFTNY